MTILRNILIVFCVCLFVFVIWSVKYKNPYKLIMIFGKKGSGKTTLICKLAEKHKKKGWQVYSTVEVPGARVFDVKDIGYRQFPEKSVIFIDEVGMIWDNRDFKNFKPAVRDYFKYQRQYRNKVYLFSQTFDVDLKLRNLTDAMYLVKIHGIISTARRIKRDIILVHPQGDSEARIADDLEFVPLFFQLFGAESIIVTFIPHWVKKFKSFNPPELREMNYREIEGYAKRTRKTSGWRKLQHNRGKLSDRKQDHTVHEPDDSMYQEEEEGRKQEGSM